MGLLTVTTAAENRRLALPAALQAELELASADLPRLTDLFEQASRAAEGFCNRIFPRDTLSETFRLSLERETLILTRFPVFGTPEIEEDGDELDADDFEVEAETGLLRRLVADAPSCWAAAKVVVAYQAGYALPSEAVRNLPPPIERAVLIIAKAWWFAGTRDPMLASVSAEGQGSETYRAGAGGKGGLPDEAEALLRPFALPAIG